MKVSFIFGTRPEAVKLAPVIRAAQGVSELQPHVCVTGQHYSMLGQVLNTFDIEPNENLNLMQENQSLAAFSSRALTAIDRYLACEKPNFVVVQGDTSTVICAALAAFYHRIPVGHVEAGLRTGTPDSPFPEEMNRALASRIASYHFAPTKSARHNLINEGVDKNKITVTGNTVIEALQMSSEIIRTHPQSIDGLPEGLIPGDPQHRIVLITGHRREHFGAEFENICEAILSLAQTFNDVKFVYPVHLNPNVYEPAHRMLSNQRNIILLEPLGYLPFVSLMAQSTLILTDSGGIQEEAPSLGKPVLVMRDSTERPEGIAAGTAKLVGTSQTGIIEAVSSLLHNENEYNRMARAVNPYGDGRASERIVKVLKSVAEREATPV